MKTSKDEIALDDGHDDDDDDNEYAIDGDHDQDAAGMGKMLTT